MKLYGRRSSINVQKVLWCLGELGAVAGRDYERIDAGLDFGVVNTAGYLALNPNGLVPTLVDGDLVPWESNTIVRYLASAAGNEALLPVELKERANVERWMDWQLATLWATLRVAFLGLTRTPEPQRDYEAIRRSHADAGRMLAIVDTVLSSQAYVAGRTFTVADIGICLSAHRWFALSGNFGDVLDSAPSLQFVVDWHRNLSTRPGFQDAVSAP
ncbi:glutathione S-transferase [Paraburkholderia terrae]|uniref:Glutathione S-transferase n=1 Tax=Paraburkholderia terrae TaxID=311230 RepID=A0ABM7TTL5_9BURK|nr:glutathione S-transferase N-terminal domain-containing protein [Paraburkholderia terrae]BCZ81783.1 glutathione S-transferase [Paraburkholderia terrae]